jgi:hypothetical protein
MNNRVKKRKVDRTSFSFWAEPILAFGPISLKFC